MFAWYATASFITHMPGRMPGRMPRSLAHVEKNDVLLHLELSVCPSTHLGWTGLDWIHVARLYDDDMETGEKQVQLMIFGEGEALVCLGCKRFI